jgi:DNA uptake protein ComE-like DNA-binding protein
VAVLWCVVILEVVVISLLHAVKLELRVAKNHLDSQQARYLALAGVEKAKALLFEERRLLEESGKSESTRLLDCPEELMDVSLGRGVFRVIRAPRAGDGPGRVLHGVVAEETRLNVNTASAEELKKLPGMTEGVAAAIADWKDSDRNPSPAGAEADYYVSLSPRYLPRDGPLETIRELLMVRGVTPENLFGEDENGNGLLDPGEDDGPETYPTDDADGQLDAGWSALLTVDSSTRDISARGKSRVNIATAAEETLTTVSGISADLAKAIVAYRKDHSLKSVADLLDVTAPQPAPKEPSQPQQTAPQEGRPQQAPTPAQQPGQPSSAPVKVVSQSLLKTIADELTAESSIRAEGLVNINSAGKTVLACLPGMDEELAGAVVLHREQYGFFSSPADLLDVPGMTLEILKKVWGRTTVRSDTYRIVGEGFVPSTRSRKRIEVVARMSDYGFETVYWREDL